MVSKRNQFTVGAAAVLALLAGCGSGGSDSAADRAVSASIAPDVIASNTGSASVTGAADAAAENAGGASAANATGAVSGTATISTATGAASGSATVSTGATGTADETGTGSAGAAAGMKFEGEAARAATLAAVVKAAGGTDADVLELQANVARAAEAPLALATEGQTVVQLLPGAGSQTPAVTGKDVSHAVAGRDVKDLAPYSVQGVSGALLGAMLDHHVGNALRDIGPTDRTFLVPVAARHGSVINDASLPMVTAGFGLTPNNYRGPQYEPARGRNQLQMYMRVQNLYGASLPATKRFAEFNMNTLVVSEPDAVSVGRLLHVMTWTPEKLPNGRYDRTGVPGVPVREGAVPVPFWRENLYGQSMPVFRRDQLVPYGSLVQQWSLDNSYVQLWLLKNGSSSQPQLCWNFWLPNLKRTYCQAWQVPAGWQTGGQLLDGGNFVNDNRMAQGEPGQLFWQQLSAAQ